MSAVVDLIHLHVPFSLLRVHPLELILVRHLTSAKGSREYSWVLPLGLSSNSAFSFSCGFKHPKYHLQQTPDHHYVLSYSYLVTEVLKKMPTDLIPSLFHSRNTTCVWTEIHVMVQFFISVCYFTSLGTLLICKMYGYSPIFLCYFISLWTLLFAYM